MLNAVKNWLAGESSSSVELSSAHFEFNWPLGTAIGIVVIIAVAGAAALYTWPRLTKLGRGWRIGVTGLRTLALALALFLVLDPCIVGQKIKPGRHYVVSMFDDSKSMQIIGEDGLTRGARMLAAYKTQGEELEKELKQKYQLAYYRLGSSIERIQDTEGLKFEERESNIAGAVRDSIRDLDGINISGVILYSDGIEQSADAPADLEELAKLNVPVFAVGVDSESQWRDIEIGKVSVSRTDFDRSPIVLQVPVKATRLAGSEAIVEVILDGRVEKSEKIAINADAQEQMVRLEFIPQQKGWLELETRVRLAETGANERSGVVQDIVVPGKDRVVQNNYRRFTFDNRQKEYRILYFSGNPNPENKFVNRALSEDDQLRMTSLIRISRAERKFVFRGRRSSGLTNPLFEGFEGNKQDQPRYDESVFLRFGAKGTELDKGYPITPDELFKYHLVIWSEIEKDFFSPVHLELTRDFVSKRGGSLLLMGGPKAFTEGGYQGTVIANMLPVILGQSTDSLAPNSNPRTENFSVSPTVEGLLTGSWSLDPNLQENQRLWEGMPPLSGINLFAVTRPGAIVTALADGPSEAVTGAPLFIYQRYGEGKCAVLASYATWPYQMRLEEEDQRHERLWRQISRSLVNGVPEPVLLRDKLDNYTVGETAIFDFLVRDQLFNEREGLQTTVKVRAPSGQDQLLAVDESIQEAGHYRSEFEPEEAGTHLLTLTAMNDKGESVGSMEEAFLVEPDNREFQKAQFNPGYLMEIADKTGGRYFTLDQINAIHKYIPWVDRSAPEEMRIHLWRIPLFFFLLIGMLSAEWVMRRLKGYA